MLLIASNKARQLLYISYIGHVELREFETHREDMLAQLRELQAGFRLLADFSQLDSMSLECAGELGRMMETISTAGVSLVVRVIPDPSKDIGMNILTALHYRGHPRTLTCASMDEASRELGL